jgi:hypothetical protein
MNYWHELQTRNKRGAFSGSLREALYAYFWLHRGQQITFKEDKNEKGE